MKTATLAVCAMFLALMAPHPSRSADAPVATPVAGIDLAAMAKSARATKLIGNKVYKGDTSIGQIEDVLVDLDGATVSAVILSVGGFLGVGDKLVAVPVTQIKIGSEARFTTDLTKDQLTSAAAFDFSKLPAGSR
jgi:sporulation protein YlmC with PRC-barrel domain